MLPSAGGTRAELPLALTKHPTSYREFKVPVPKAVAAFVHAAGGAGVMILQFGSADAPLPAQHEKVFWLDVKSEGLPKKFHCSPWPLLALTMPVPLKSFPMSCGYQGWPLCKVTMELTCQP